MILNTAGGCPLKLTLSSPAPQGTYQGARKKGAYKKVQQQGWTDFFLGSAQDCDCGNHSLLDGTAKVGLHFRREDAFDWGHRQRPSREIPPRLWASFKQALAQRDATK